MLDRLADDLGVLFRGPSSLDEWNGPRGFEWARAEVPGGDESPLGEPTPAFLLKPGTYMNRSGEIVAPVVRWLMKRGEIATQLASDPTDAAIEGLTLMPDPDSILVVYDDMDLDTGRLRLRPFGGHGGQNGMRSIIDRLATDRFPRLRVGIGRAGTDAARHVLSPFSPSEREDIEITIAEATEALVAWLRGEAISDVMTRFHSRWNNRDD